MRPLAISAATAIAAVALLTSPAGVRPPAARTDAQLTPALQSGTDASRVVCAHEGEQQDDGSAGVGEISWFQGTLEEAFVRHSHGRSHHGRVALFHF
jgi:hypothetical protein